MRIVFIGYGEAARAFRASLHETDAALGFGAFDVLFEREGQDGATASAARRDGCAVAADPGEAVRGADWIVSAVTADQSLAAAKSVAPHLGSGQLYIDINSVSPDRKRDSAALVMRSGAAYLDMAVMAPVHPRGHRTPVLTAGPLDEHARAQLERLDFRFEHVGETVGRATAIKMVRSLFVKGLEAITVETLLAASKSGCFDRILVSLSTSYPGLGWPDIASYQFDRTVKHGARRAAEMIESGRTLDALGLKGDLARAIAGVQALMGGIDAARLEGDADLKELTRRLAEARDKG